VRDRCEGQRYERVRVIMQARRTPRPCSVCGAPCPCERRERRLIGRALAVGVRTYLGGLRWLTLEYSLLLSVWVDPYAEHSKLTLRIGWQCARICCVGSCSPALMTSPDLKTRPLETSSAPLHRTQPKSQYGLTLK